MCVLVKHGSEISPMTIISLSKVISLDKRYFKAKGKKKNIIKKQIRFNHYKNVLFNKDHHKHKINIIRSMSHDVSTLEVNKVSLSCYDDKRYALKYGVSTLAYGHHSAIIV